MFSTYLKKFGTIFFEINEDILKINKDILNMF